MSVFFFLLVSGVWHAMFISYCEKVSVVSLSVNIAPQKKIRTAICIYDTTLYPLVKGRSYFKIELQHHHRVD